MDEKTVASAIQRSELSHAIAVNGKARAMMHPRAIKCSSGLQGTGDTDGV